MVWSCRPGRSGPCVAPASMVSVPVPVRLSATTSRWEPSVKSATASIVPVLPMLALPVASSVPLPLIVPPVLLIAGGRERAREVRAAAGVDRQGAADREARGAVGVGRQRRQQRSVAVERRDRRLSESWLCTPATTRMPLLPSWPATSRLAALALADHARAAAGEAEELVGGQQSRRHGGRRDRGGGLHADIAHDGVAAAVGRHDVHHVGARRPRCR